MFCSTCFARDRKVQPLGVHMRLFNLLIGGYSELFNNQVNSASILLCWECRSYLTRTMRFVMKVWEAQRIMMFQYAAPNVCLSSLAHRQNAIDFEYMEGSEKIDIKDNIDFTPSIEDFFDDIQTEVKIEYVPQSVVEPTISISVASGSTETATQDNNTHFSEEDDKPLSCQKSVKRAKECRKTFKYEKKSSKKRVHVAENKPSDRDKFRMELYNEEDMWLARAEVKCSDNFLNCDFKCKKCLIAFENDDIYFDHMEQHKPNGSISLKKCPICEIFCKASTLDQHKMTHYHKYICLHCDTVLPFSAKNMLDHYYERHYVSDVIRCEECGRGFRSQMSFKKHLKVKHPSIVPCAICNILFPTEALLREHLKSEPHISKLNEAMKNSIAFKCATCDEAFLDQKEHIYHERKHKSKPYCVECGILLKNWVCYVSHRLSLKHTAPSLICDYCGKKFPNKGNMVIHINQMHMERKLKCPVCDKKFGVMSRLRGHVQKAHSGKEKPKSHICDICERGFKDKAILGEHMAKHTGLRPHKCPFCQKDFGFKAALFTHKRLVHKIPRQKDIKHNSSTLMADVL